MASHAIKTYFYIGNQIPITSATTTILTNDVELDKLGSIWGESQVLQLGAHFDVYSQYGLNVWALNNQTGIVGQTFLGQQFRVATNKVPGTSVSGNFGEVLTILALESLIAPQPLRVCHLCSTPGIKRSKCPDILVESSPLTIIYNVYNQKAPSALPNLPSMLPGECKNNAFLKGLRQLATYWSMVGSSSPAFGFGLISSIKYRTPCSIKFNILVPININGLNGMLSQPKLNISSLRRRDFKGYLYGF